MLACACVYVWVRPCVSADVLLLLPSIPSVTFSAPRLLPGVEKVSRAAADPELRDVATNALDVLTRVAQDGEEAAKQPQAAKADVAVSD